MTATEAQLRAVVHALTLIVQNPNLVLGVTGGRRGEERLEALMAALAVVHKAERGVF